MLTLLCGSILALAKSTSDIRKTLGEWTIRYNPENSELSLLKSQQLVLDHVIPEASYQDTQGTHYINSALCSTPLFSRQGNQLDLTFTAASGTQLCVSYALDGGHLLTSAAVCANHTIRSNYVAPICISRDYPLLKEDESNRMLKVPFDNDDFVRYHQYAFGQEMTSFEAGALYCGQTRQGLVIGSVDHDHWKSGIVAKTRNNGHVRHLRVYSGMSHRETRDVLPHGYLEGQQVRSARFFLDFCPDWRLGMESFAQACLKVVPGRHNWTLGTPFGWQSWGVMSDKNSFEVDVAVSQYMHDVLQPGGFCNEQGKIVMSIDAWDNLADKQKDQLCQICEANNQIPGTYWTPFCLWWDAQRIFRQKLPGQDKYMAYECILKANGEFLKYDGAYCLDPTHPGVKAWIDAEIRKIKGHGFRYLKIDFTDNGMIQADSYYDPQVHTGVEAYNQGFQHFIQQADQGTPLYIALSIAPIFPYQYGNSRRIACDTWGAINQTEYSMNAISGGWWTGLLYQYNDPDHCPLIGNDDARHTTESENRARYTNLMCAGMALVCDNFDLQDRSGRGDAKLSRERAPLIMMNADINAIGRLGQSFRPVYGHKAFQGNHGGAESIFQLTTSDCTYVAVFNYSSDPISGEIPAADLGVKNIPASVKELWTQQPHTANPNSLPYSVPARDVRVYRF